MLKSIFIPAGTAALAATLVAAVGNVLAHEHPDPDGEHSFEKAGIPTPAFAGSGEPAHPHPAILPVAGTFPEDAGAPGEAQSVDVAASAWMGMLPSSEEDSPAGPSAGGSAFLESLVDEAVPEGSREETVALAGRDDASGKAQGDRSGPVHLVDLHRFQGMLQATRRFRFGGADLCQSLCLSVSFHSAGLYALQGRQRKEGVEADPRFVLDSASPASSLMSLGGQELRDLRLTFGLRNKVRTSLSLKSDRIRVKFYMKFNMF